MNQKQVWNKIATPWEKFRNRPEKQVTDFLEKQHGKILDLGAGTGRYLTKIKNGKMYEVDFSSEMLKFAKIQAQKQNIPAEFKVANTTNLPFKDNYFNAAIFISTLHCIESEKKRAKTIQELYRVLKPKAKLIISVWGRKEKRIKNKPKQGFIPWTHKGKKYQRYTYIFDKEELENLLKKIGFLILNFNEDKNLTFIVQKP